MLNELRFRINEWFESKRVPRWIDIKKKQPKDGQVCLVWFHICGIDIMTCHINKGKDLMYGRITFVNCSGFLSDDITHWMPIEKGMERRLKERGYVK